MIDSMKRIYPAVLEDMALASTSNQAMSELFVRLGYMLVPVDQAQGDAP
jgi:hypothetical protein